MGSVAEDVLDKVAVAPTAVARWRSSLEEFASHTEDPRYRDPDRYPEEEAFVDEFGFLVLSLRLVDCGRLAMKIPPSEWRWADGALQ